jgi:hypothetical protein
MILRLVITSALMLFLSPVYAQENVKEPSTGKNFPGQVSFTHDGKNYTLTLTGVSVRKKLIFKVYGMAHYIESFSKGSDKEAFDAVMAEGKAKQITMEFARDVDAAKIRETYGESFKEHATVGELKAIKPSLDQFLGFFTQDVKENDRFVLRWIPGGTITSTIIGQEKPPITDAAFARILWSIWFGEDSVVDRDDLVQRMVKE